MGTLLAERGGNVPIILDDGNSVPRTTKAADRKIVTEFFA